MTSPVHAYRVPALEKGLDILELLSREREPLSLIRIASSLDRTRNEIFRMLNCLEKRGYLVRDGASGTYSLSLRLFEMAHTHSPVEQLIRAAALPMRHLSARLGESCHLSIIRQKHLLVVAQVDSPQPIRLSVEVGSRFPLTKTVSGRLLLALLAPEDVRELLGGPRSPGPLTARLRKIRQQGFSAAANESFVGLHDLAVPVGRPELGFCAALAITSIVPPRASPAQSRQLAELRACAQAVHRNLGLAPG